MTSDDDTSSAYGANVYVDDDGDFNVGFSRETETSTGPTDDAPATVVPEVTTEDLKKYAVPLGIAAIFVVLAVAFTAGK